MNVRENEYGISMTGQQSQKKPGTFYFDGAARFIQSALEDGLTNVSVYVSEYGPTIQMSKPFPKKDKAGS